MLKPSGIISRASTRPAPAAPAPVPISPTPQAVARNLTPRNAYKEIMEKYDRMRDRHISPR